MFYEFDDMKKIFIAFGIIVLCTGMLHAQKVVDVNELPQPKAKEINKWIQEEQSAQTKNKGFKLVNAYGVNVFAPNLVEAIRFHLRGSGARIEGDQVILRQTMSIQYMKDFPLWVLNGVIYEREPFVNFNTIREVRVLKSAAETNRYGALGNAGVIEITTE